MSAHTRTTRKTVTAIRSTKGIGSLVSLTAYSAPMAKLVDEVADVIIVGDSVGMVLYGMPDTLRVTLDMMIAHGAAVVRGAAQACVVVDLPFSTYQESPAQAYRSAARLLAETGAQGVKLEGGSEMADTIRFPTERGIPVMAHVGLMPQQANATGGFRAQGWTRARPRRCSMPRVRRNGPTRSASSSKDGRALARHITETLTIPTIGIGASPACDGQVLVTEDMIGAFDAYTPRFVKRYADANAVMREAIRQYAHDVRQRVFRRFGYGKPLQLVGADDAAA